MPVIFLACIKEEKVHPIVVNYSDEVVRNEFDFGRLDSSYVNLLSTIDSEEEGDSLYKLWLSFHKQLNDVMKNKKFDWEIEDSLVIIWDRLYCDENGNVDYYIYNIADTTISSERKSAFGNFIESLDPPLKYPVHRDVKYAQCGTYRHYSSQTK